MAEFVVYSYQFSPSFNDAPSLFPEERKDPKEVWENKQKYFEHIFNEDFVLKYRGAVFNHELLYNENGLIAFRIANNKHLVQEAGFKTKRLNHNPSCLVLIDNRKDVQNIYIENNEYSFSDTSVVSRILSKSFCASLKTVGLIISINQKYNAREFWQFVELAEDGIEMLRFSLQYPNLPSVRRRIDSMLSEASKEVHSKQTNIEFNAGQGETLELNQNNEKLKDLVDASAETGNSITLKIKGLRKYRKVGNSVETVEIDNLEAALTSDLLSSASQKLLEIINSFKS